jgi:hypothetical protein
VDGRQPVLRDPERSPPRSSSIRSRPCPRCTARSPPCSR